MGWRDWLQEIWPFQFFLAVELKWKKTYKTFHVIQMPSYFSGVVDVTKSTFSMKLPNNNNDNTTLAQCVKTTHVNDTWHSNLGQGEWFLTLSNRFGATDLLSNSARVYDLLSEWHLWTNVVEKVLIVELHIDLKVSVFCPCSMCFWLVLFVQF